MQDPAAPIFDETAFYLALGRKISAWRMMAGMRQRDLAGKMGAAVSTVCRVESGKYPVGLDLLQRFADVLGVTALSLLPKM